MKKALTFALAALVALGLLAGCGTAGAAAPAAPAATAPAANGFDENMEITVVTREDGSGTRGAFIELTGVEEKNDAGDKVDNTTVEAITVNSTSVVMTTVAGDPYAIGYISLGSLNDTVKALEIDGVAPSVATVKDGSYTIARPFNLATKEGLSEVAQDFMDYIMSAEGQKVVEANGYISAADGAAAYDGQKPSGKVVVAGSSSVTPVMEKLKEAYAVANPNAEVEIQMSDSSTGMTAAIDGICDIGMASRELKDSETEAGLAATVMAMDGIAIIVNKENPATGLTVDQLKSIYIGDTLTWGEIA